MKASMSGQKISLRNRLRSSLNIFKAYRKGVFGEADQEFGFYLKLKEVLKEYGKKDVMGAHIMDLGCGQRATQMALFQADGAEIIGIDMEVPTYRMNFKIFFKVMRINGPERAVKSLIRHILYDKSFYKTLSQKYGKPVIMDKLDIRLMDATRLSFEDNTFDYVYSAWVFEHIDDVDAALGEMSRVLKTDGIIWIGIHLYPSLSGGHNLDWMNPDASPPEKIPPWDHLLENRYPANAYLNKLKLKEHKKLFVKHFKVLDMQLTEEGHSILNPDLEKKLGEKGYTREDLLTRIAVFICRKK
jgi:SAM-dependent methyltransferase